MALFREETELEQYLGIQYIERTPDRVVATMPVDARHHQPMGYLHGGVSVLLAETVVSIGGSLRVMPEGKVCMGQEINANHVRPVRSGTLKAIGTPIHVGRNTQVWEARIFDDQERLVCISRCTLAVVSIHR